MHLVVIYLLLSSVRSVIHGRATEAERDNDESNSKENSTQDKEKYKASLLDVKPNLLHYTQSIEDFKQLPTAHEAYCTNG